MQKIYIVGSSGSGKSTLAKAMSEKLGIPRQDLDELYWQPGWTAIPQDQFMDKVHSALSKPSWIIEGAQDEAKKLILKDADTLIWVDPGLLRIFNQLVGRTYDRIKTQKTFCNGNTESWANTFSSNSIFVWATRTWKQNKENLGPIFEGAANNNAKSEYAHLDLVRLDSRGAINEFVRDLPTRRP